MLIDRECNIFFFFEKHNDFYLKIDATRNDIVRCIILFSRFLNNFSTAKVKPIWMPSAYVVGRTIWILFFVGQDARFYPCARLFPFLLFPTRSMMIVTLCNGNKPWSSVFFFTFIKVDVWIHFCVIKCKKIIEYFVALFSDTKSNHFRLGQQIKLTQLSFFLQACRRLIFF